MLVRPKNKKSTKVIDVTAALAEAKEKQLKARGKINAIKDSRRSLSYDDRHNVSEIISRIKVFVSLYLDLITEIFGEVYAVCKVPANEKKRVENIIRAFKHTSTGITELDVLEWSLLNWDIVSSTFYKEKPPLLPSFSFICLKFDVLTEMCAKDLVDKKGDRKAKLARRTKGNKTLTDFITSYEKELLPELERLDRSINKIDTFLKAQGYNVFKYIDWDKMEKEGMLEVVSYTPKQAIELQNKKTLDIAFSEINKELPNRTFLGVHLPTKASMMDYPKESAECWKKINDRLQKIEEVLGGS